MISDTLFEDFAMPSIALIVPCLRAALVGTCVGVLAQVGSPLHDLGGLLDRRGHLFDRRDGIAHRTSLALRRAARSACCGQSPTSRPSCPRTSARPSVTMARMFRLASHSRRISVPSGLVRSTVISPSRLQPATSPASRLAFASGVDFGTEPGQDRRGADQRRDQMSHTCAADRSGQVRGQRGRRERKSMAPTSPIADDD
jgi:hypothetical protein